MADYSWPAAADRKLIGTSISRVEDPLKVSGKAQYTTDFNLPGMLFATTVRCPYPHAKIVSIDTTAAQTTPGFKAVYIIQKVGTEILSGWRRCRCSRGCRRVLRCPGCESCHRELQAATSSGRGFKSESTGGLCPTHEARETLGNADSAFLQAKAVVEQTYTMPVITHCCLEPHGSVVTWSADSLDVYISTQSVSGIVTQMSKALGLPASKIRVRAQFEGGGFGSKLAADRWGLAAAQLSKLAGGVPVRLVVDRRTEQQTAGCRPSAYGTIKIGSNSKGNLTAWQATTWTLAE